MIALDSQARPLDQGEGPSIRWYLQQLAKEVEADGLDPSQLADQVRQRLARYRRREAKHDKATAIHRAYRIGDNFQRIRPSRAKAVDEPENHAIAYPTQTKTEPAR
jgi:hypothetical protein